MTDDNKPAGDERRIHHAIRKIFAQACILLAPLMKENDKTLSISGFAMVHMVQEHFPGLSASDARIVIAAIERLHRENRLHALLERYAHE